MFAPSARRIGVAEREKDGVLEGEGDGTIEEGKTTT